MKFVPTKLLDVLIIEPRVFGDQRGFFLESWNEKAFQDAGLSAKFVQDNHSRSMKGVLRGLHFQNPSPQGKLVRVTQGAVYDVAVDLRQQSDSFGQWVGVELSAENHRMLWIPEGFAHGFLTLKDSTDFHYKCTSLYAPEAEQTLSWNDPDVAIDWPLGSSDPIISSKDAAGQALADVTHLQMKS